MVDKKILVIDTKDAASVLEEMMGLSTPDIAYYYNRERAEADPSKLQIIPYCLVKEGDKILTYTRGEATTEKRLAGNKSIGFGGHIDLSEDNLVDETSDPISSALYRELHEELGIVEEMIVSIDPICIIYDPSNDVGKVHVGIGCVVELEEETIDMLQPSDEAKELKIRYCSEIMSKITSYETWSQQLIRAYDRLISDDTRQTPEERKTLLGT